VQGGAEGLMKADFLPLLNLVAHRVQLNLAYIYSFAASYRVKDPMITSCTKKNTSDPYKRQTLLMACLKPFGSFDVGENMLGWTTASIFFALLGEISAAAPSPPLTPTKVLLQSRPVDAEHPLRRRPKFGQVNVPSDDRFNGADIQ
jgi:hypothetical protein